MQRNHLALLLTCCSFICLHSASGQAPASTTPTPAQTPGPEFGTVYGKIIQNTVDQITTPETATKVARFQKLYYDALIKEGFSHDDAIRLVASTGVPFGSGVK